MTIQAGTPRFVDAVETGLQQAGVDFGRQLLIAFSGGPDSSALLLACIALRDRRGLDITAAHFNHRLAAPGQIETLPMPRRSAVGSASNACRERVTPSPTHDRPGRSLEAAARELRYAFLADAASAADAQAAATGHTMDDQAETVLLNITRGAGLRGLAAMRGASDLPIAGRAKPLRVVRPMLGLRKSEAAGYCRQLGLTPLLDHTNDDTRFPRNKLRRDVIPILESINPNVTEAISRLARTARDDFEVIDAVSAEAFSASVTIRDGSVDISKQALRNLPVPVARRVLMTAYESVTGTLDGLESAHLDAMLEVARGRAGASVDLTGGVQLISDRHVARLAHRVRQTTTARTRRPCPNSPSPCRVI